MATNNGADLLVQIPSRFIAEYFEPMINRHDGSERTCNSITNA